MEELGSGFLSGYARPQIRGTGEVLGENQSGNMMEIGFQLYNEMLHGPVESLRREPGAQPAGVTTQINLHARPPAAVRLLRRVHCA
jgi:transcription-repair coupling factor (superfamily II helicase)